MKSLTCGLKGPHMVALCRRMISALLLTSLFTHYGQLSTYCYNLLYWSILLVCMYLWTRKTETERGVKAKLYHETVWHMFIICQSTIKLHESINYVITDLYFYWVTCEVFYVHFIFVNCIVFLIVAYCCCTFCH